MAYVPIYMFSSSNSHIEYNCTRVVGETYKCIPIEQPWTAGEIVIVVVLMALLILLLLWVALNT